MFMFFYFIQCFKTDTVQGEGKYSKLPMKWKIKKKMYNNYQAKGTTELIWSYGQCDNLWEI